jgi:propanol-preferring alcohol dehydrogenase
MKGLAVPQPGPGQVRIKVATCGVCRTELDEIEGRSPPRALPVVPGHQIVGRVEAHGAGATRFAPGERVGVAWIFSACGTCQYCRSGSENLCPDFTATGRDVDGGYAEYVLAPEAFAYPIPEGLDDAVVAPLLCAGAIGFRALRLAGIEDGQSLGLSGFGASGHLVLSIARHLYPRSAVFVFARSPTERAFALELGADWAGDFSEPAPTPLQAVIDTTPAWLPVRTSLAALAPGGRLVINAISKSEADKHALADLDYTRHLWLEKEIKSVANITRRDVTELMDVAVAAGIRPQVSEFPLEDANAALLELHRGDVRGAKVLRIS